MDNQDRNPVEERRFPHPYNPCKFTLDRIRQEVIKFSKDISSDATVLDFGCGAKPYQYFIDGKAKEYIGLDIDESPDRNPGVDEIIAPGEKIPYADGYFDAIICTQVFEHLKDPEFYGAEFGRVLKSGGIAFVSSAFAWEYHPYPKDYWRITEDGYRIIFKDFSEILFEVDTNSLQTIIQSLNFLMDHRQIKFRLPYYFVNFVVSKLNYKKGDRNFPGNLFVYLRK